MKRTTIIIIACIVLLAAGIIAINWSAITGKKKQEVAPEVGKPAQGGGTVGVTGSGLNATLVLREGSIGAEVVELQTLMNNYMPSLNLSKDGNFGALTVQALLSTYGSDSITLTQAWSKFTKAKVVTPAPAATDSTGTFNWLLNLGKF